MLKVFFNEQVKKFTSFTKQSKMKSNKPLDYRVILVFTGNINTIFKTSLNFIYKFIGL